MAPAKNQCRRCSECRDSEHHWMENPGFADDEELPARRLATHCCKHCDALAMECQSCDGEGYADFDEEELCPECRGAGCIEIKNQN